MSGNSQPTTREQYLTDKLLNVSDSLLPKSKNTGNKSRKRPFVPNIQAALSRSRNPKQDNIELSEEKNGKGKTSFPLQRKSFSKEDKTTVQSHSVFEFGPAGRTTTNFSPRKVCSSDSIGGMPYFETSSNSISKINSEDNELNMHDQTKESFENELAPVNLPFLPHQVKYKEECQISSKVRDMAKLKFPDDQNDKIDKKMVDIINELKSTRLNSPDITKSTCDDNSKNKFVLLQLPDGFPIVPELPEGSSESSLALIGKIKIYKSGKSSLILDGSNVPFKINAGIQCPLLQKIVLIDKERHDMNCLGDVRCKFVLFPNVQSQQIPWELLEQPTKESQP